MSDTFDSPTQSMNGDASNQEHVTEEDDSNGVINQEEEDAISGVHNVESKEDMFEDAPEDMHSFSENGAEVLDPYEELRSLQAALDKTLAEKANVERELKEEREGVVKEVASLLGQIKGLADKQLDISDGLREGISSDFSLLDLVSECSQFVSSALEEKLRKEGEIRELHQQIEEINAQLLLDQNIEIVADRVLGSLSMVVSQEELLDHSVVGKLCQAERSISSLVEQYRWVLYELDQLKQCLSDGGSNIGTQEEFWPASVLNAARAELLEVKTKEAEFEEKVRHLEEENRKIIEEVAKERATVETMNSELGKAKADLEQEKTRCANTKEKLTMAVTKGKALVQQRDSLKQSLAEKSSELERCLEEIKEKTSVCQAVEQQKEELIKFEGLVASLEQTLSQRDAIIANIEDIFAKTSITDELEMEDIIGKSKGLVNLVASLQEMVSQKNSTFQNFEEIFSQVSIPNELNSADVTDKLKWLVDRVSLLQETVSQQNLMLDKLEGILSQITVPDEFQYSEFTEKLRWLVEETNKHKGDLVAFEKLNDLFSSFHLPETVSLLDVETKINWLKESINKSEEEISTLRDEVVGTREAAHDEIDRLSASLSEELQEKEYIKLELDGLRHKLDNMVHKANQASSEKDQIVRLLLESSGATADDLEKTDTPMLIARCFERIKEESYASLSTSTANNEINDRMQNLLYVKYQELMLCEKLLEDDLLVRSELNNVANQLRMASLQLTALKEEKDSLQKDLERSEEKSALVREKLSLAVKKGKGLVQDRENLKLLVDEKKSEIEKLQQDLQLQESSVTTFRDQINQLSIDVDEKNSEIEKLTLELQQQELTIATCKNQIDQLSSDINGKNSEIEVLRLELQQKESNTAMYKEQTTQLSSDVNEKNSEIEHLKLELEKLESFAAMCKDQINQLSASVEQIPKLEADHIAMKDQQNQLEQCLSEKNSILQSVLASVDRIVLPVDITFEEPVGKVDWLAEYVKECEQAKLQAEQGLESTKEESRTLASQLKEVQLAMKSVEDELLGAKNHISQLTEEKREMEVARRSIENDLQNARNEATLQTAKLTNSSASLKPIEDALCLAENKISQLLKEKDEAQLNKAAIESELQKLREEAAIHMSKLTEAYGSRQSLEDALSQAEANVSLLTEQNNKLKHEVECQAGQLADTSTIIKLLEDELSKATSDISVLDGEKRIAKQEISALNAKLTACMDELAGKNNNSKSRSVDLIHQLSDLRMVMKDGSALSVVRKCFMKDVENLNRVNVIIKDINNQTVNKALELLQGHSDMEADMSTSFTLDFLDTSNFDWGNDEVTMDTENIALYIKKTGELFQSNNKILVGNVEGFSKFLDEFVEDLLKKLGITRNTVITIFEHMESMKENMNMLAMNEKEKDANILMLQKDCETLLSACVNSTNELRFEIKNNLLELSSIPELEKLRESLVQDGYESADDSEHQQIPEEGNCIEMATKLISATRKIRRSIRFLESASNVAATTIEHLHNNWRQSQADCETAIEEKHILEAKFSELETHVESLQNSHEELSLEVQRLHAIEEKLKEKEIEVANLNLLMKQKEDENAVMSTSQLRSLFDKIREVEIFSVLEDIETDDVKRLFYIVDSVNDLQHELKVLSHDKNELQLKLSAQDIEIERVKDELEMQIRNKKDVDEMRSEISELTSGLEKIVDAMGGKKIAADQNPSSVWRLLQVLEKHAMALNLEAENSKSLAQELGNKLTESQNVIDELSKKMKLLEDSLQSTDAKPELVQDSSIFEATPLPSTSEISEIDDVGMAGKNASSTAPTAAHVRMMRKGSTDHLALNMDIESASLINGEESNEDKGHLFKSLNTTGLIPRQGKSIADRVDGLWVSGGRVLMSRPRARLGVIVYSLLLHLWLLGTIL